MKRALRTAVLVFGSLFALVVTYAIFSPYFGWYFMVPGARIEVNGQAVRGQLHRDKHGEILFLTRRYKGKTESYMISLVGGEPSVASCGSWTAPISPAFPIGDVNPPCWSWQSADIPQKRVFPARNVTAGPRFVEFTADDGTRTKVLW